MRTIRTALIRLASDRPELRATVVPLTRQADKWQSLPNGWTNESRKKFWDTLTGDNKHKVTKCIKEMEKKDGIDNPGAFCASLADRVLGPEWRKKKAAGLGKRGLGILQKLHKLDAKHSKPQFYSTKKLPQKTVIKLWKDGYLEPRMNVSDGVPNNVRLTAKGSRAVKADKKGAHEQTPNVVDGNVHDADSWRTAKLAFNKYNAPEVMGQLMSLLKKNDLDDPVDLIKRHKIPQAVDEAWKKRDKRASRLAFLRQAADIRKVLSQLFAGHQPFVKDWGRFFRDLTEFIHDWEYLGSGYEFESAEVESMNYASWEGKQTAGGWHSPPEYEEHAVEVAEDLSVVFSMSMDLRKFPQNLTKDFKALVSDVRGFEQATADMVNSKSAVQMLGKLLLSGMMYDLKQTYQDGLGVAEAFEDEIYEEANEATESGWSVNYSIKGGKFGRRPRFKVTGGVIKFWVSGTVTLEVTDNPEPPERDYDGDGYRYASRLAELRLARSNLHLPREATAMITELHKLAHDFSQKLKAAGPKAGQILGNFEDAQYKAEQAWAAAGNHPDDFTDKRVNPEGDLWNQAYDVVQWLEQMVDPRREKNAAYRAKHIDLEFEKLLGKVR